MPAPPIARAPAPAPAEARPLGMQEAAHARPVAEKASSTKSPAELQAAQKVAAELREFGQKNPSPEDPASAFRLRMTPEKKPLGQPEKANLGKVQDAQGKVPATEVQQVLQFEQYTNVQSALQKGQTLDQACQAQGLKTAEYQTFKDGVMDGMAKMKVVQEVMPGLSTLSPEDQRDYLENYLGANPAVRTAVLEKAHVAATKAAQLAEGPQGGKTSEMQQIDQVQGARLAEVNKRLGLTDSAELKPDQLEVALQRGDVNEVRMAMYQKALEAKGITPPAVGQEYMQLQDEIANLDARIATADKVSKAQLQSDKNKLQARQNDVGKQLKIKENDQNDVNKLKLQQADAEAVRAVYGTRDRMGNMIGGVDRLAQDLIDGARQKQTLETKAKVPLTAEQQAAHDALREEVGNIMESALVEVIAKQHDELRAIQDRKILADADVQEKAGQHAVAQAEIHLVKQMGENGVKVENGKRIVNRKALGEKAKFYGDHGKAEATPRLILRDVMTADGAELHVMNHSTNPPQEVIVKMNPDGSFVTSDGVPYQIDMQEKQADGSYHKTKVNASWQNISTADITGESKTMMDTLIEKHGPAYEQRFLLDYNMARMPDGIRGIASFIGEGRELHLSKAQKGKLLEDFGQDVLKAAAEKALGVMNPDKLLREKGIKMDFSWLMMLIMLLGAGGKKLVGGAQDFAANVI